MVLGYIQYTSNHSGGWLPGWCGGRVGYGDRVYYNMRVKRQEEGASHLGGVEGGLGMESKAVFHPPVVKVGPVGSNTCSAPSVTKR